MRVVGDMGGLHHQEVADDLVEVVVQLLVCCVEGLAPCLVLCWNGTSIDDLYCTIGDSVPPQLYLRAV